MIVFHCRISHLTLYLSSFISHLSYWSTPFFSHFLFLRYYSSIFISSKWRGRSEYWGGRPGYKGRKGQGKVMFWSLIRVRKSWYVRSIIIIIIAYTVYFDRIVTDWLYICCWWIAGFCRVLTVFRNGTVLCRGGVYSIFFYLHFRRQLKGKTN